MIRRHGAKFDFYATLDVKEDASQDEIRRAYRRAAMKYHPDKNPGNKEAEAMFILCAEAYETLGDPEKRTTYDHDEHPQVRTRASGSDQKFNFNSLFVDWLKSSDLFKTKACNFAPFIQYQKRTKNSEVDHTC